MFSQKLCSEILVAFSQFCSIVCIMSISSSFFIQCKIINELLVIKNKHFQYEFSLSLFFDTEGQCTAMNFTLTFWYLFMVKLTWINALGSLKRIPVSKNFVSGFFRTKSFGYEFEGKSFREFFNLKVVQCSENELKSILAVYCHFLSQVLRSSY